jgi:hypothetical protein
MIYGEILSLPRKAGIVPLLTPYILYAAGKRLYMYAVPVTNLPIQESQISQRGS